MKRYFIYLFSCLMVVSGCSSESRQPNDESTEKDSYIGFLNIDGTNYSSYRFAENGEYTVAEEFGEVEKKIPGEVIPTDHLTSNYLEEGTKIFSVKDEPEIFLVKEQNKYHIFKNLH